MMPSSFISAKSDSAACCRLGSQWPRGRSTWLLRELCRARHGERSTGTLRGLRRCCLCAVVMGQTQLAANNGRRNDHRSGEGGKALQERARLHDVLPTGEQLGRPLLSCRYRRKTRTRSGQFRSPNYGLSRSPESMRKSVGSHSARIVNHKEMSHTSPERIPGSQAQKSSDGLATI